MRKIKVDSCIGISKLNNHLEIKDKILSLIDCSNDSPSNNSDGSFISKYDYPQSANFDRRWVKDLKPYLLPVLVDVISNFGYQGMDIYRIWYQQYLKGSSHCWHIHEGQFTGVYYLEHPEGSPATEIKSPYNLETFKVDTVSEGDVIVFPAFWIHQAPINEKSRKTIISFNLNIRAPDPSYYDFK